MARQNMLTTTDNPYDPFTQWSEWFQFDTSAGYHTTSYLARVLRSSDELSQADQSKDIEDAIDEIVRENILGIYKKVTKDVDSSE